MRTLLIFAMAALLVAAIAVTAALWPDGGDTGPPASSFSTQPALTSIPGVEQPSRSMWNDLLPKLEQEAAAAPQDVNLQRKLALAYYNLGRYDEAVVIYQKLLAQREDAVLCDRLGNVLRDRGDSAAAEAAYRQAIKDDPARPSPYLNLADLLWRQGKDGQALTVLGDGLTAVPPEGRAALEQGKTVIENGG